MSLTRHSRWLVVVATVGVCLLLTSGAAWGQSQFLMGYFSDENYRYGVDQTVRIINPGTSGGNLCAMIYVFNQYQHMKECCGCLITPHGLLELSVTSGLTDNPFDNEQPNTGNIKVIAAAETATTVTVQLANGTVDASTLPCDPSGGGTNSIVATNGLLGWSTHLPGKKYSDGSITETKLIPADLSAVEEAGLQEQCAGIIADGSGYGICYGVTASNVCNFTTNPVAPTLASAGN